MLGDVEDATKVIEDVFCSLANGNPVQLQWHTTLAAVHRRCAEVLQGRRPTGPESDSRAPAAPATDADDDTVSPSAPTLLAALAVLSDSDRELMWEALMGGHAASNEWEPLSEGLRRLEIAINNQDIPGDGAEPWLE